MSEEEPIPELNKLTIDELIKLYKERMQTTDVQDILKEKKNRLKEEALKFDKEILDHYLEVFKDDDPAPPTW